ncbi:MAG: rhomboid family intramembrane serine protease [Myxococcota bacterium]
MTKARLKTKVPKTEWQKLKEELRMLGWAVLGPLALMWIIEIVDVFVLGGWLDSFGLRPREPRGLWGILSSPFLHGGFPHLLSNTVGFLVFGTMLSLRGFRRFVAASFLIAVVGGLGVWLLGRDGSVHVGASGVVFGYFGYLLTAGLFERRIGVAVVSIGVFLLWGWMLLGVLPGQVGVSWEGHLFGFLAGVLAARIFSREPLSRILDA